MIGPVSRAISRHQMLTPGDRVIAAVSGGPDSVCLLDILARIANGFGASLAGIAHLNHKLRGDASDRDESFVQSLAQRYGVPFHREQADLAGARNLEEAARSARRDFFIRLIRQGIATRVATGHTLDDQAETVLFRILRGTGPTGLSGIVPVTADGLIRPLIGVGRAEVEEYLNSRGLESRQDATNLDARFSRNRIRHELLPLLRNEWNPRIAEVLARYADIATEEEGWWEEKIEGVVARVLRKADGGFEAETSAIAKLPKAVARRLIRSAFQRVRGAQGQPDFHFVERVLDMAESERGAGKTRFAGVEVMRSFGLLRFQQAVADLIAPAALVNVPGRYPFGSAAVCFDTAAVSSREAICASLKLQGLAELMPLRLRSWRVGDRYHPVGKSREYSLHELFQKAQIPSWRRQHWPIVLAGSQIVWVRKFGAACGFAAQGGTSPVLRIWEDTLPNRESSTFETAS